MVFWDSLPEPGHLPRILSWHFLCTAHWQTAPNKKIHRRPTQKIQGKKKERTKKKKKEEIFRMNYIFFFISCNTVIICVVPKITGARFNIECALNRTKSAQSPLFDRRWLIHLLPLANGKIPFLRIGKREGTVDRDVVTNVRNTK